MSKKLEDLKVPGYAVNPIFNSLDFKWLLALLQSVVPEHEVNVYGIYNKEYRKLRKESGKFSAYLSLKRLIDTCLKMDGVLFVADYEDYQFFVVSKKDISQLLINQIDEEDNILFGATASKKNDNAFTIVDRCLKAVTLAHKAEDSFIIL